MQMEASTLALGRSWSQFNDKYSQTAKPWKISNVSFHFIWLFDIVFGTFNLALS